LRFFLFFITLALGCWDFRISVAVKRLKSLEALTLERFITKKLKMLRPSRHSSMDDFDYHHGQEPGSLPKHRKEKVLSEGQQDRHSDEFELGTQKRLIMFVNERIAFQQTYDGVRVDRMQQPSKRNAMVTF